MSANNPTDASAPFDDPKADVILRSSDCTDFRVFKVMLSLASPVFDDMFGLPQSKDIDNSDMREGIPVVNISEHSRPVRKLLELCHPQCSPVFDNTEVMFEVWEMALKYHMEGAKQRIKEKAKMTMMECNEKEPMRVYAMACFFGFADEAKRAAKSALRLSILDQPQATEMKHITGTHLHKLYEYYRKCAKAASAIPPNSEWLPQSHPNSFVWFEPVKCQCSSDESLDSDSPRVWWLEYMRESSAALEGRPDGTTVANPKLVYKALKNASACGTCRARAFDEMEKFVAIYAAEVDEVISKIKLKLRF